MESAGTVGFKTELARGTRPYHVITNGWQSWDKCRVVDLGKGPVTSSGVLIVEEASFFPKREDPFALLVGVVPDGRTKSPDITIRRNGGDVSITVNGGEEIKERLVVARGGRQEVMDVFVDQIERKAPPDFLPRRSVDDHGAIIYYPWPSFGRLVKVKNIYVDSLKLNEYQDGKDRNKYVLVEDGYQRAIGDWGIVREGFGESLPDLARKIKEMGFSPGIWLAPFLVSPLSESYRKHKDWLIKDKSGELVVADRQWLTGEGSGILPQSLYALDPSIKEVRDYIYGLGREFASYGFSLFKLDFLYAGVLGGDIENYRLAIKEFRRGVGDKTIMGCGAPVIESMGLFEWIRGSSDSTIYPFWSVGRLGKIANYILRLLKLNERAFKSSFESFRNRKNYFGGIANFIPDGIVFGKNFGIRKDIVGNLLEKMLKEESVVTIG